MLYGGLTYSWYMDVFSLYFGIFLIFAVSLWHSKLVGESMKLQRKVGGAFSVFIFPLLYAGVEFLQRQIPFINEWWFVPYAKSQWGFVEALGLLSITGISGVSFILLLSNSALSEIITNKLSHKKQNISSFFALFMVALSLGYGYYKANLHVENSVLVAAVSDMANSISGLEKEGYFIKDENISQKIFDTNIKLSEKILHVKPDFIVWSENEFISAKNEKFLSKLKNFSRKSGAYLVVDSFLKDKKLYDSALLIDKNEIKIAKKTHLFGGEINAGFSPSNEKAKVFESKFGKVGVGVCFDFHFSSLPRELTKQGAKILLFPSDDDMNKNKFFPYFHATDAVFRAIENNIPLISANTNGASVIVNSNGKIQKISPVNQQSVIVNEVSLRKTTTIFTRYGEWFGWLLVFGLAFVVLKQRFVGR